TSFNPQSNSRVFALAVSGSTVYAGGDFVTIGGQSRNRIAALDATSGLATAWNPAANDSVRAIAVSGSTGYAGGLFTQIRTGPTLQNRNRGAGIGAVRGLATPWNPDFDVDVLALRVADSSVYAGGKFTFVGGQARRGIAQSPPLVVAPDPPTAPVATAG